MDAMAQDPSLFGVPGTENEIAVLFSTWGTLLLLKYVARSLMQAQAMRVASK